jgi:hypothetical protein
MLRGAASRVVIDPKTAGARALTIPPPGLARADRVRG